MKVWVKPLYISCLWALDLPKNLFSVSENGSFDVYRQGSNSFIYIVSQGLIDLTIPNLPSLCRQLMKQLQDNSFSAHFHFQHIRVTGTNKFSPFFDGFHVSGRNSIKNEQCNVAKFKVRDCFHILSWIRGGGQQMMKNHYEGDLSRRMHDFLQSSIFG